MHRASRHALLRHAVLGGALLALGGCSSPYAVTDAELKARGEWTDVDARARALIGRAQGAIDYRPVRKVAWARKFTTLKSAVETLFGLNYEAPYVYAAQARAYVVPQRDRPAAILPEEWDQEPAAEAEATPAIAWQRLRRQLERDMRELFEEDRRPAPTERIEP